MAPLPIRRGAAPSSPPHTEVCPGRSSGCVVGAFQGSQQWGDLYFLLGLGLLGWTMKRLRWPRPPLALGFVLGPLLERYLFISVGRYGADWPYAAKLVPRIVAVAAIVFLSIQIFMALFVVPRATEAGAAPGHNSTEGVHMDITTDFSDIARRDIAVRTLRYFGWCLFLLLAASIIGLLPAMFLFMTGYMWFEGGERWRTILAVTVPVWLIAYGLFHRLLNIPWPDSLFGLAYPVLRETRSLAIF